MNRFLGSALLCSFLLATAGCESSEERAEKHFEEGVQLLEAGDVDRALVEFRNVFRLDGRHKEARRLFAQAEIDRGNIQQGYSQYLRLVEQYPEDVGARRELTRLALERGEWSEVEKHAAPLIQADSSDALGRLADISLRYRDAIENDDAAARAEAAEDVRELREELPDNPIIPELLADHLTREGQREDALAEVGRAIELSDEPRRLYMVRLSLLQEMGDFDAVESTLQEMIALYPQDAEIPLTLMRWYLSQDRVDDAEAFLRERASNGGSAERVDLVRFVNSLRGREAAIAELDRLIAEDEENAPLYRSIRAGFVFEAGQREEAIAELQSIVDSATEDNDRLRNVKLALAQMLEATGNSVGARALVEDVLATDPSHTEAVKMRARWLIESDDTDAAISALRSALEQSPRDPSLMTLMAQAYERAGNRALMAEMLSLAVEVSNRAPAETIRYARHLISEDNASVAERALVDSLRLNPGNQEILQLLGSIYVQQADWQRATQVADTLGSLDSEGATVASNELRAQILAGQGRSDEVVGFLEQMIDSGEGGFGAHAAIVRTHVRNDDLEAAMEYIDSRLASAPEDTSLRFLKGVVSEAAGDTDAAETIFSELAAENPNAILVWRALYLLQRQDDRHEDALATLESALEANPDSPDLLWIKASELQLADDLEGALEIYARMYEQDSSAPVIANNYASLLTTLRDDEESLRRAYSVARRLQGLEVPAFQDTFGWIAYLRGDYEVAVAHLEPAAEALVEDPSVQYHAALAYEATGRTQDAISALERAVELGESGGGLPQLEEARQKLADLRAGNE